MKIRSVKESNHCRQHNGVDTGGLQGRNPHVGLDYHFVGGFLMLSEN